MQLGVIICLRTSMHMKLIHYNMNKGAFITFSCFGFVVANDRSQRICLTLVKPR